MKSTFYAIGVSLLMLSCTQNERVKSYGATGQIILPKGQKLIMITWKSDQIWYLTRPMIDTDTIEIYKFQEESAYGILEGSYSIFESK